ncbi:MAG: T9SS type A sorting domain-containing protein, partial [Barnesiella sp.]|nr:T9SS type A sorting domain-containing protein [Barnesiella sp.]
DNLFTVDMSSYPTGIYYLRVVTDQGKVSTKKIMKR